MDLLSAGEMASFNNISKKALRLYREEGILEPAVVNPKTGYCYYTREQGALIDTIQQMQAIGFTLTEIKKVLDSRDTGLMYEILECKTEEIERRLYEAQIARHAVNRLMRACNLAENQPPLDRVKLEWVRRRRIARFPITPYEFLPLPTVEHRHLRHWEIALGEIKQQIIGEGLPLALFHNVGCVLSQESIMARSPLVVAGFINDDQEFFSSHQSCWEEGHYLTVTVGSTVREDGTHAEWYWLNRMLDIAEERGYVVTGDYHCDILLESPLFAYEGRDIMMRMFLPVDIRTARPYAEA